MGGNKKKKTVKKRIPLPLKPPKVELDPKAYKRREKHPLIWQQGEEVEAKMPPERE